MGTVEEVVATATGRVEGTTVDVDGVALRVFRGIPYARADRFDAPAPARAWTGTRDATRFGPAAPQSHGGALEGMVPGMTVGATDEDACLTLNVWAPAAGRASRPVLVWFHGGSFVIGAASQPVYDGARLAAAGDLVVVSANYRLGALGFLDARAAGGVANCGLRDAVAALEWVRDNIAAFGGDPQRICAFGGSAGGGLVLHAVASPTARGLLRGAIVQSGVTDRTLTSARAALVADALCTALGVADVRALRALPVEAIVDAQAAVAGTLLEPVGMMPFHPMVDGDVVTAPPAAALAAGVGAGVALLAGTTSDEMRLFVGEVPGLERDRLVRRVARYVDVDAHRGEGIVAAYERALGTLDPNAVWAAVFSDVEMQRPLRRVLDAHACHGPTFTYLFTWEAPGIGACHGIDVPFPFGTLDVDGWDTFAGVDDDARRLSHAVQRAWSAFAHEGDPGWARSTTDDKPTRIFGRDPGVVDDPLGARLAALPK